MRESHAHNQLPLIYWLWTRCGKQGRVIRKATEVVREASKGMPAYQQTKNKPLKVANRNNTNATSKGA